jgi:membrane protein YdbS with pleckstrin-like domain
MSWIYENSEKILKAIAWITLAALILAMALIAYSGRMYVLPYNSVLVICAGFVVALIGFWIYAAIKGVDNVFVNEVRGGGEEYSEEG